MPQGANDSAAGRSGRVEAYCDPPDRLEGTERLLRLVTRAAESALDAEHRAGPDSVTVVLSDDSRLRSLNLRFNGNDSVTDVLSFNEVDGWRDGTPPVAQGEVSAEGEEEAFPGVEDRLGDIVISVEQAFRQAEAAGVHVERELAMLTVHGVMHLLGYDHAEPEEERVMFAKTDALLERLFKGVRRPKEG